MRDDASWIRAKKGQGCDDACYGDPPFCANDIGISRNIYNRRVCCPKECDQCGGERCLLTEAILQRDLLLQGDNETIPLCCIHTILWKDRECTNPADTSCVLPLSVHDVSKEEVRQQLDSIQVASSE